MFLQSIISSLVPKSSCIPSISSYLLAALLLSAFNVAASSCVYSLNAIDSIEKYPRIFTIILRLLSILVCYKVRINFRMIRHGTPEDDPAKSARRALFTRRVSLKSDIFDNNQHSLRGLDLAAMLNRIFSAIYLIGSLAIIQIYITPLFLAWLHNN